MPRVKKVLIGLSVLAGLVVLSVLFSFVPFRPVVLLRTSAFRSVPQVNNEAFRRELDRVLSEYDEPHVALGNCVFVLRSLARDKNVVCKFTQMALLYSGQEEAFFADDEEVMTWKRMETLMDSFVELEQERIGAEEKTTEPAKQPEQ